MSPATKILTAELPPRRRLVQIVAQVAITLTLALGLSGTTFAIEQPPALASQQRAWLLSHLVTDMQNVGTFQSSDIARMVQLVNTLGDDQIGLLSRFYYLTREKTEQDAELFAVQQTDTSEALAQAKAQVADLLAQLQNQINATYSELASINPGCQTLCQFAYASLPGWCAYNLYAIPDWYYSNGCFVGPAYSAGYCGGYAVPLYGAFYNHGSRYNYWNSRDYVHHPIAARVGHYGSGPLRGSQHPVAVTEHRHTPALKHASVANNHRKGVSHPKAGAHAHQAGHRQHVAHVAHSHHAAHGSRRVAHGGHHGGHAHAGSGHGRHK
jgi:hypothetical protein